MVTQERPEIVAISGGRNKDKKRVVDEQRRKHVYFRTVFRKKTEENGIWGAGEMNILEKGKGSVCLQQEQRKKEWKQILKQGEGKWEQLPFS